MSSLLLSLVLAAVPLAEAGPAQTKALSYAELMRIAGAFQESRVVLSAIELDIFTAVGEGAAASRIADRINADRRSTETLLNALVALGALTKDGDTYRNTPATARYLVEGSADCVRGAAMHTVDMWPAWSTLTESVRAGTAIAYKEMAQREKQWMTDFIEAMHRGGLSRAASLVETVGTAGVKRLLDIGGGSGVYSIAFAKASGRIHAEVLDLPAVVLIARRHIREAGLAHRVTTRVGDLRSDPFGTNYDLVLLSAICHMLSPAENRDLFRRCFRALGPGGRVVVRDFILNPDRTSPRGAVLFSLNMLVATEGGGTYAEAEYAEWLREAGFSNVERATGDVIIAIRR